MQRVDRVTFTFEDNGRLHGDLVLRIGLRHWRCDSYHLWCDGMSDADADPVPIVRDVLAKLIEQWAAAIRSLPPGKKCFLPFDFSDQSTGWLRCTLESKDIVIQRGWSSIEGWSFDARHVGELLYEVSDFRPDGEPAMISREELLRSIGGTSIAA